MKIKSKNEISLLSVVLAIILVLYSALFLYLIFWAIITAFKTNDDFTILQNYLGLPKDFMTEKLLAPWDWKWENFTTIMKFFEVKGVYREGREVTIPFDMQVLYTVLYAGGCAFIGALCPCLVAYATSKFKTGFNYIIDVIVIVTMVIPIVGSQVSMISLLNSLDIYDTFLGLYLQKFNFANMHYLMFAAVFKGVSKEYYEAATIDGASELKILIKIALPLVATSFGLIFLLMFIGFWNDYQTLILYAPSHPSIAYGLFRVMTDPTGASERGSTPVQMAGCILIVIPVFTLFIIFRNKLMGNLTIGGVKE